MVTISTGAKPITYSCGTTRWYLSGLLHREDGPAIIRNDGAKFWYKNGRLHREDGPAIIWKDGEVQWWLNHDRYRFDDFCAQNRLSETEIKLLLLKYGNLQTYP